MVADASVIAIGIHWNFNAKETTGAPYTDQTTTTTAIFLLFQKRSAQ
jgi:hypothetical protein